MLQLDVKTLVFGILCYPANQVQPSLISVKLTSSGDFTVDGTLRKTIHASQDTICKCSHVTNNSFMLQ